MANLDGLKRSIQNLNRFIKESAEEGSTFQNHATFNILAKEYGREVFKAKHEGLSEEELAELLREENKGMQQYRDYVYQMKNNFNWNNKKTVLN